MIEKISGKLASRPKLGQLLARLERGDAVVVTRLRRIGRNRAHLLALVEQLEASGIDFIVLEQGIDTATPIARLFFRFLAALAEFDREAIVEGTLEGLESARARGRTGGRPPKLTQVQLDQAQRMYDDGQHTADEITAAFHVARSTLYQHLAADGDCVLVAYRNTAPARPTPPPAAATAKPARAKPASSKPTASGGTLPPPARGRLKGMVFVADGTVTRIRAVQPDGQWQRDDRGYADIPLTPPLTDIQIARQFPTLGIRPGDHRPHVRGKIREYLPL